MLKTILFFVVITFISLPFLITCDTTEPPDNNHPDTTSQNFTFETFEFGDGYSSSYFKDVWIFDENNIWAVGEVYLEDGYTNIMRWDGKKWYPQRPYLTSSGIEGIWSADSSNIYFASGAVRKYENGEIIVFDLGHLGFTQGQAVHKLWGSSESNIWGVGPWGTIVHYDGKEWKKIEFDNQWHIFNITGNKESGVAYAVARNTEGNCIIIQMKDKQAQIVFNSIMQSNNTLKSWSLDLCENTIYLGGADLTSTKLWEHNLLLNENKITKDYKSTDLFNVGIDQIKVVEKNDIYFFGSLFDEGIMIHFNGKTYKEIRKTLKPSDIKGDCDANTNLCATVGFSNNKAYITLIRRN